MKNAIFDTNDILNHNICGLHQYSLSGPAHITYASQNLCDMLGVYDYDLLSEDEDKYISFVHPSDRAEYADFIKSIAASAKTKTMQYRLIKRDGSIIYVSDTISVKRDNGALFGISVLTDISEFKNKNNDLQFLNDTTPCGFLKYTCEEQPKITYINDRMAKMLRFPDSSESEADYLELYKKNIYLLIPMEERQRFAQYLKRVYLSSTPLAGEMTILRFDGTKGYFFGWVTKYVDENGMEEFQSVCIDISQRHYRKQAAEISRYIKALTDVYDTILEYNLSTSTAKCLFTKSHPIYQTTDVLPREMRSTTENWINTYVSANDRSTVNEYFERFFNNELWSNSQTPAQIKYHGVGNDGAQNSYTGIFLKVDSSVHLFCCRLNAEQEAPASLISELDSLKNMQDAVMTFTDGVAAFEVIDEAVTPLYSSSNICSFFGYTEEEWQAIMKQKTPFKEFVSRSKTALETFVWLFDNGEAEFSYFDTRTKQKRRIKTICTQKSPDKSSPRYVMMYHVDGDDSGDTKNIVSIRTFGYFDVFVGDKPIAFRSQKSKELFALLVDRRGGYVSSDEAISFLWPDEPSSAVTLARYRKVALRLKNILEEYGISHVVEAVDGKRRIATDKVRCDLFDYLTGKEEYSQLFKGSYLTNYSWGETTLGELSGDII